MAATVGALVTTGVVATSAFASATPPAAVEAAVPAAPVGQDTADSTGSGDVPGTRHPVRGWWKGLTDEQRQCVRDTGLTRPAGRLTDAERAALRTEVEEAAATCGVELPFAQARAWWGGLTDDQQQCLRDLDVTRPVGRMSGAERQQFRADVEAAAQEECGVELPTRAGQDSAS